jgi:hypothetical protein
MLLLPGSSSDSLVPLLQQLQVVLEDAVCGEEFD